MKLKPHYNYDESPFPFFVILSRLLSNKDFEEIYSNYKINITITSICPVDNFIILIFGKATIYHPTEKLEFTIVQFIAFNFEELARPPESSLENFNSIKLNKILEEISKSFLPMTFNDIKIATLKLDTSSNSLFYSDSYNFPK